MARLVRQGARAITIQHGIHETRIVGYFGDHQERQLTVRDSRVIPFPRRESPELRNGLRRLWHLLQWLSGKVQGLCVRKV